MENINVIDILKLGLSGLVFLLSLLSFYLLTKEQEKNSPGDRMLKSIRHFMYVNIFLAVLTIIAPIVDKRFGGLASDDQKDMTNLDVFPVMAKVGGENPGKGNVAVCLNVPYSGKHLLITDSTTGKIIQVWARPMIPCTSGFHISLTPEDATNLGWTKEKNSSTVAVAPAKDGQMFVPMPTARS